LRRRPQMDFTEKVVVVTGTSSGIGQACAKKLLDAGARVAGFDINEGEIPHERFAGHRVDVTDEKGVKSAMEDVKGRWGRIDGLVTCAGVTASRKAFYEMTVEEWEKVLGVNLTGTFLCAKHAARVMMERKRGKIVTVGCVTALSMRAKMVEYASSKGGVAALTSAMAMDLAAFNIQVNSVAPGVTRTGITQKALGDPEMKRSYEKAIPLGRVAEPEDIARVVVFLLSEDADYMTAQTVVVDGGYSKSK
jgi:NAD(P)-dependent dehydrogenase (short-subunit alcohol dehydrogenase family)